ncbi:MAG: hypothetical protein WKF76_03780 [Nocardioidaceae bacterium]
MSSFPVLLHTALDARDCRGVAEFYRQFLGLHYREGKSHQPTAPLMTRTGLSCSTTTAAEW